jgi:hypothetical protein
MKRLLISAPLDVPVGCRKVSAGGSVERLLTDLCHRRSQWWFAAGTSLVFLTFSNLPLQIWVVCVVAVYGAASVRRPKFRHGVGWRSLVPFIND